MKPVFDQIKELRIKALKEVGKAPTGYVIGARNYIRFKHEMETQHAVHPNQRDSISFEINGFPVHVVEDPDVLMAVFNPEDAINSWARTQIKPSATAQAIDIDTSVGTKTITGYSAPRISWR